MEGISTIELISGTGGVFVSNKIDKILKYFEFKHPNVHINVYRSSKDPEVGRMLRFFNAEGSAALNLDTGEVDIQINDETFRKSVIYEELAHALQYHRDGNVEVNSLDYYKREIEVAQCMLDKVARGRLRLKEDEIVQTENNLRVYQEAVVNLGGVV
ncbi:hypothetical protein AAFJ72_21210 [Brevibacillus gelatini]|uniref:hypothetical protein n=1 Tax=Brevibacillus gelatini TaxID=1655277 RepID=UPI003D817983